MKTLILVLPGAIVLSEVVVQFLARKRDREAAANYPPMGQMVDVHGDADTIVPLAVHSARIPDQIEGANVTVLPGVGHMPQHTNPGDVIATIDRVATRAGLR